MLKLLLLDGLLFLRSGRPVGSAQLERHPDLVQHRDIGPLLVRAIELAVYRGYGLKQLSGEILSLAIFSAVLVPLSLAAFRHSVKRARREGSLIQY